MRGQLTLMALAALSLVVLVVVVLTLRGSGAERERSAAEREAEGVSDRLSKEQQLLTEALEDALSGAVYEMGQNGGYTAENRPQLKHLGIPLWLHQGKVVNVPTLRSMEEMLAQEVERRVGAAVERRKAQLRGERSEYSFGSPEAEAVIEEEGCHVTLRLPVTVQAADGTARAASSLELRLDSPLRLGHLRRLAEEYVRDYREMRFMETALMAGISEDDRIWEPPGRMMHSVSCASPPYRTKEEMVTPMRENCQLAVARELKRIRTVFRDERHIEWNLDFLPSDTEFSFVADNGQWGYPTERIYLVPQMLAPFSPRSDVCISHYEVTYDISFPVRVTLLDLLPTSNVVGGGGSALAKPLELRFYVSAYLGSRGDGSVDTRAVNASVGAPETVDSACTGSCTLDVSFTNADSGRAWLDTCPYGFEGGRLREEGVACGVHTLAAASTADPSLGRLVERVNVQGTLTATYTIPPALSVEGTVYEEHRLWCERTGTLTDAQRVPLGARGGSPPAYIEVLLVPLEVGKGGVQYATADDAGRFSIPHVTPGLYWLVARPSRGPDGAPTFDVDAEGRVVTVAGAARAFDLVLEPVKVVFANGQYVRVSEVSGTC